MTSQIYARTGLLSFLFFLHIFLRCWRVVPEGKLDYYVCCFASIPITLVDLVWEFPGVMTIWLSRSCVLGENSRCFVFTKVDVAAVWIQCNASVAFVSDACLTFSRFVSGGGGGCFSRVGEIVQVCVWYLFVQKVCWQWMKLFSRFELWVISVMLHSMFVFGSFECDVSLKPCPCSRMTMCGWWDANIQF